MPDLPILRGSFTEAPPAPGQLAGRLHRRPGSLRHVRHELHRFDQNRRGCLAGQYVDRSRSDRYRTGRWAAARFHHMATATAASPVTTGNGNDVVLGVEVNYIHGKFGGSATGTMGRSFVDPLNFRDDITYASTQFDCDLRYGNAPPSRRLRCRLFLALSVRRHCAWAGRYHRDRHDHRDSGQRSRRPFKLPMSIVGHATATTVI